LADRSGGSRGARQLGTRAAGCSQGEYACDVSGGIYLLRGDDDLVEMNEAPYDSEDVLQTLLAKYPSLLEATSCPGMTLGAGC